MAFIRLSSFFQHIKLFGIQVAMETEGFAIYDAMMQLKNEVCFLAKPFRLFLLFFCWQDDN